MQGKSRIQRDHVLTLNPNLRTQLAIAVILKRNDRVQPVVCAREFHQHEPPSRLLGSSGQVLWNKRQQQAARQSAEQVASQQFSLLFQLVNRIGKQCLEIMRAGIHSHRSLRQQHL